MNIVKYELKESKTAGEYLRGIGLDSLLTISILCLREFEIKTSISNSSLISWDISCDDVTLGSITNYSALPIIWSMTHK